MMHKVIRESAPSAVIVDPLTSLAEAGAEEDLTQMVLRLVDFLKANGVTSLFTSLTHGGESLEATTMGISSLMDTWILLRDIELNGERNRGLYVLKSRGMAHSNQIREFQVTSNGIRLIEAYLGPEGVLTGSARLAQERRERELQLTRATEDRRRRDLAKRKLQAIEAQIAGLRAEADSLAAQSQEENEFADALAKQ